MTMHLSPSEVEKLSSSSIVVTGGAGFIGSNLVEELVKLGVEKIFVIDNFALEKIGGKQRGDAFALKTRKRLREAGLWETLARSGAVLTEP
jgi:nucleoside-diphosphate-sugar epimerase